MRLDDLEQSQKSSELVLVDKQKIIDAGKQLKMVVKLILFTFLLAFIAQVIVWITEDYRYYYFAALVAFILYIAQLVNLFQAGNDLIKSVSSSKSRF